MLRKQKGPGNVWPWLAGTPGLNGKAWTGRVRVCQENIKKPTCLRFGEKTCTIMYLFYYHILPTKKRKLLKKSFPIEYLARN